MDCEEIQRTFARGADVELTADERAAAEQHFAVCTACRRKWDPAYQSQELHLAVKELRRTTTVKDGVMAKIRGQEDRPAGGSVSQEPDVPERIAGFEVVGTLGRGGMGTVLKARQVSMDRFVALKVLSQRLAPDEAFVSRFIREAHAAAKLRHPHIVQGFDAGVADGYYYFAMEYVDGEGLDEILAREGPIEPGRALQIMKQTCSALWAAHEAGIIHRDIKPSNIMLDSKGDVRVTDFGLAKCGDAAPAATADTTGASDAPAADGGPTMTARGQMLGTPAYLAPEVAKGLPADARSDLYSLGATFFHVLTGRPPFEGKEITEVVIKQVREAPPATADAAPRLDPRLCRILDRLLQKDPAARPASARALLEELDALGPLQSADEAARAEGIALLRSAATVPLPESRRLERRLALEALQGRRWGRKRVAMACAGIAALLTIGILAVTRPWGRAPKANLAVIPDRVSKKAAVTFADPREEGAEALLRDARASAGLREWEAVKEHLKRLDEEYSDTQFYQQQIVAIGELRARADAAVLAAQPPQPDEPEVGAAPPPLPDEPGEWVSMFDGKEMGGWRVVEAFPGAAGNAGDGTAGRATVADGQIRIEGGKPASGIVWTRPFPTADYELSLEAMRVAGEQDFATLTFPLGKQCATLLIGARHGPYTGLSYVDGRYYYPANITTRKLQFAPNRWYQVRLLVTRERVAAWVDDEQLFDLSRRAHKIGSEIAWQAPVKPLGITTWKTTAALRDLRVRRLVPQPAPEFAAGEWVSLLDGRTLNGWQVLRDGGFAGGGPVGVEGGRLLLGRGAPRTGIAWTGQVPSEDYEIAVKARREAGRDSFCGLYFPVGDSVCTLSVGGYGGDWIGLANVDGRNPTQGGVGRRMKFEAGRWYTMRLRVTKAHVEGWVDDKQVFGVPRQGHTFTPSLGDVPVKLAVITWETAAGIEDIRMRQAGPEPPAQAGAWVSLFEPGALAGWEVATGGRFAKHGRVHLVDETVVLEPGEPATGILCRRPFPKGNYEVAFEMRRDKGLNHAHVLFPIGGSHCLLNLGGWAGDVVGLSLVDGQWAPENGTAKRVLFQPAGRWRWYRVRLRVTEEKVEAWLDDEQVIDLARAGHTFAAANWPEGVMGFCLSNWESRSAFRNITVRPLGPDAERAIVEQPGEWVPLFDGKTLDGWRAVERFPTVKPEEGDGTGGQAHVADGRIVLDRGRPVSAIAWQREFPRESYELSIEAMRVKGGCDFCNLAFPVGDSQTTLCVGTWPNRVELRYFDGGAVEMEGRRKTVDFQHNRWYRVGVRVTPASIRVTLDDETLIDLPRRGLRFYTSIHHAALQPFGIGTWDTEAAYRDIRVRRLGPERPRLPDEPGKWALLFDGEAFKGWRALTDEQYARHGKVGTVDGCFVLGRGDPLTGIEWLGEFPAVDYEVSLEARRDPGSDAYWYVCLPTAEGGVRLEVGEWKGTFLGLSCVDGQGCQHNDTGRKTSVPIDRWFRVRARVTEAKIEAWLDDEQVVDLAREGRRLALPHSEAGVRSLALGTCYAAASFRNIQVQRLPGEPEPPPEGGAPLEEATVPLSARADWLDTGLYLRKGQAYQAAATGRWGHRPSSTRGPDGQPRHPKHHLPDDGPMAHNLIGRVGRHGRPFSIGGQRRLEPAQSGRLYLRMNDDYLGDNWGSLSVRVQGPLVAAKDAPLLSRFPKAIANAKVGHHSGWVSTGIEVQAGDRFLLRAEGTHLGGPLVGPVDADGLDGEWSRQRMAALIGRIGQHGARFPVCRLLLLEVEEPGALYLTVNSAPRPAAVPEGDRWRIPGLQPEPEAKAKQDGRPPEQPAEAPAAPEGAEPLPDGNTLTVTILAPEDFDPKRQRPNKGADLHWELLHTLRGHSSWVICTDFSPDGTLLASAGRDKVVRIWDVATGRCLKTLSGHGQNIESVVFSPDGKHVLSTGGDRTLRLWDVATGRPVREIHGHQNWTRAAAFFPDGKRFASADATGVVKVWDTGGAWAELRTLRCQGGCWAVVPFRGGDLLAAATDKGEIRIWDPDTGHEERAFFARMANCWSLAVSPDGRRLAAAGDDPVVRVWDAATGERLGALPAHGMIRSVAFSPDGKLLAAGAGDRTVRFWDAATYRYLRSIEGHTSEVRDIAFSPDGRRLATASFDTTVKVWALEPEGAVRQPGP